MQRNLQCFTGSVAQGAEQNWGRASSIPPSSRALARLAATLIHWSGMVDNEPSSSRDLLEAKLLWAGPRTRFGFFQDMPKTGHGGQSCGSMDSQVQGREQ